MQRFLHEEKLEELGIAHFDAWAATFAQTVTSVELAPDASGDRSATRFAAFNNAPELAVLFSQVTRRGRRIALGASLVLLGPVLYLLRGRIHGLPWL
jgi:hypothetical protein